METKNKNYKLVIFDVDGTMLDTSEGLLRSVVYMIQKLGYQVPEQSILESFVGPRIQDSLQRVYGLEGESLNRAAKIFRDRYKEGDVLLAQPYEGIYDVLEILREKNIQIAVATNKRQDFVDELMIKYNFQQYIKVVLGTDFAGKLKKADLLRLCMEELQIVEPDSVVLIGDSAYDAEAAEVVGINFIGVTYGFDFKTKEDVDVWKNVGCASDVFELKKMLG